MAPRRNSSFDQRETARRPGGYVDDRDIRISKEVYG
jgi:hypothetical protein